MIGWVLLIGLVLVIALLIGCTTPWCVLRFSGQRLADIDVQLRRRYDLIPNLVETVKAMPGMKRHSRLSSTLAIARCPQPGRR